MNVVIAEDETLAAERLEELIRTADPGINIIARYDSVQELIAYFRHNSVDLLFMDIQLADGKSFEVFNKIELLTPVIFTTAYDQYALQAFKLHSIDYLLKPIQQHEVYAALKKFKLLHASYTLNTNQWDVLKALAKMPVQSYKQRFLVKSGNKLLYKHIGQVTCFFADGKLAYLATTDHRKFLIDHTLEELELLLNPETFFRISRKVIVNRDAITEVKGSISSGMEVFLNPPVDFALSVSRDKITGFKKWLDR
ncbi:MAG TPA: LytTR family DNA-binding domain-containing protein [Ohtaekwangia sp.]